MKDFLNWAFYGDSYKDKNVNTIYRCYLIYCDLFNYDKLSKFKFIELYQAHLKEGDEM